MSVTYHMAKAYQELLLRDSIAPLRNENLQSGAGSAPHPAITAVVSLLAAPLLLLRRAINAETTA